MNSPESQPESSVAADSVSDLNLMVTVICSVDPTPAKAAGVPFSGMPEIGTVLLNRWQLIAFAGVGSASLVYRGLDLRLSRSVAVKIVNRPDYPERAKAIGHLRNEAQLLQRLGESNAIVRLWDFHDEPDCPMMVTDYVEGNSLGELIRKQRKIDVRRVLRIAQQIVDALAYAWEFGVVHRDVKPDNILLADDGTAKLIDFGLAAVVQTEHPPISLADNQGWVGTAAYLAPEQARSTGRVDHRSDMYSLGATLYHALTGRLPVDGDNAAQVILKRLKEDPIAPHLWDPKIPRSFSDLVMRLLAREPDARYPSYIALRQAINDLG